MKKILSLLLVVAMCATMFVACGKKTETPPETEQPKPTESVPEKTPDDDKEAGYSAIENKYIVITTNCFDGFENIEEFEKEYDDNYDQHNLEELTTLLGKMGQTVVTFPRHDNFGYEADDEGCVIYNQNGEHVAEVAIFPGDLFGFISEEDLELVEEKNVNGLAGAFYKTHDSDDKVIETYIGRTTHNAVVVVGAYEKTMLDEMLEDMVIFETAMAEAVVVDDAFAKKFDDKNAVLSVSYDYQSIWTYNNDDKYIVEDFDGYVTLYDKKTQEEVMDITIDEAWYVVDEMNYFMDNLKKEDIYKVDTDNFIGYIFVEDNETYFFGVDKNACVGLIIEGFASVEDVFGVVSKSDMSMRAFIDEDVIPEIDIQASYDESTINWLASELLIVIGDINTYDLMKSYAVDNVSCYAYDKQAGSAEEDRIYLADENKSYYMVDDTWRMSSGEYFAVGKMKGLTITFNPELDENGDYVYIIRNGVINQFVGGKDTLAKEENQLLLDALNFYGEGYFEMTSDAYAKAPVTIFLFMPDEPGCRAYAQFGGRDMLYCE